VSQQATLVPSAPGVSQLASPLEGGYLRSVNAYVLEDEGGYTLVDSGVGSDEVWELFCAGIASAGIAPRHIRRVLLTHGHHDHSGLAARLAGETGAEVWMHARDVEFFERRFVRTNEYMVQLRAFLVANGTPPEEATELTRSAESAARVTPAFPGVATYQGDDVFEVGEYRLQVVWTPGHTPGHVCFLDPARRLAICGDHILPTVSPNVAMMPDSDLNPLPGYLDSMRSFAESDYEVALPGHGDAFDIGRRARKLLEHQLERQARVREILSEGPATPYEVAEGIWRHTQPNNWSTFRGHVRRNAIQTIIAHLELLVSRGEVARSDGEPRRYELTGSAATSEPAAPRRLGEP
jgi:glyoxylase-like metal-dependent hydrolase (beta-lactamase superfamily II)